MTNSAQDRGQRAATGKFAGRRIVRREDREDWENTSCACFCPREHAWRHVPEGRSRWKRSVVRLMRLRLSSSSPWTSPHRTCWSGSWRRPLPSWVGWTVSPPSRRRARAGNHRGVGRGLGDDVEDERRPRRSAGRDEHAAPTSGRWRIDRRGRLGLGVEARAAGSVRLREGGSDPHGASLARELATDGIRVNAVSPGSMLIPGKRWDRMRREDPPPSSDSVRSSQGENWCGRRRWRT